MSQMWMNSGDPTKLMQPNIPEEEEVDDEDMGVAETYADYMPTKRMIIVYLNLCVTCFELKSVIINSQTRTKTSGPGCGNGVFVKCRANGCLV